MGDTPVLPVDTSLPQPPLINHMTVTAVMHYVIVFSTYIFLFIDFVMNHGGFILSCPK